MSSKGKRQLTVILTSPVIMDTPTWVPRPSRQPVVCIHILLVSSYVAHCDAVSSVPRTCTTIM